MSVLGGNERPCTVWMLKSGLEKNNDFFVIRNYIIN